MNDPDPVRPRLRYIADPDLLTPYKDRALVRLIYAAKHLDQSRLTGSILSKERMDFSLLKGEIYSAERIYSREALLDSLHFQNSLSHLHTFLYKCGGQDPPHSLNS